MSKPASEELERPANAATRAALAVVRYTPAIDLSPYLAALEARRIEVQPITWPPAPPADSRPWIYLVEAGLLTATARDDLVRLRASNAAVYGVGGDGAEPPDLPDELVDGWLDLPLPPATLRTALLSAVNNIRLRQEAALLRQELDQRQRDMAEVHRVGIALSSERDFDKLQSFILGKCREMTSADAGTLYLIEETVDGSRILRFSYAQNDSIASSYERFTMPLNTSSMAGYVALTGKVLRVADSYDLPPEAEYGFNRGFDRAMGYRTKSQLVVPMANHAGEIIGVIQLMNRKWRRDTVLSSPAVVEQEVIPFTEQDEELVRSFASQAAVALDNKMLLDSIENLFEGFVKAAVTAIESRDPTTSGHSGRVAELTVGLAEAINRVEAGAYAGVYFPPEAVREIRYASLLHDFGKVGVREAVLLKAKKLYPWDLEVIRKRFGYLKALLRAEHAERKLELLLARGRETYLAEVGMLEDEHERMLRRVDNYLRAVIAANEPTILEAEGLGVLREIMGVQFEDEEGRMQPLLDAHEVEVLSIRRGSLDERERQEINSHVSHTFRFLSQIPWTRSLQHVPTIAYAHHEWLNGAGYPLGLRGDEIPIQAKMMAIADVYDALTASDRPYKPAVPTDRALGILHDEVQEGHIDGGLLEIFIAFRVYERTLRRPRTSLLEPALSYRA